MSFFRNKWFIFGFIIASMIVIFKFVIPNTKIFGNTENNSSPTTKVGLKNLKQTLTLSGKIAAEESVNLRFQTSGKINWIGVKIGDKVQKNQLIATLDQRDVQKNLSKKLNDYLSNRWDFEQTQQNNNVNGRKMSDLLLTDAEKRILEKSQFDLNNSVIDVEIQNLALEYANLITPISGIITQIDAQYPGINITPAGAQFKIVNPDSIYLSVNADQNEVTLLKIGMNTYIIMDSYPDQTIQGTIDSIAFTPKPDETNTVYEVKVKFPGGNPDYRYRIDMTADANFITNQKEHILAVSTNSIRNEGDKKYVYIKKNGTKLKTYIQTGDEFDNETEIISGLSEGDFVYD